MLADGFVHPTIGTTADETDDVILVPNPNFRRVAGSRSLLIAGL